ncbi:MAG: hypothetical protein ACI965_002435, partial [Paraglaciecola sp.]
NSLLKITKESLHFPYLFDHVSGIFSIIQRHDVFAAALTSQIILRPLATQAGGNPYIKDACHMKILGHKQI